MRPLGTVYVSTSDFHYVNTPFQNISPKLITSIATLYFPMSKLYWYSTRIIYFPDKCSIRHSFHSYPTVLLTRFPAISSHSAVQFASPFRYRISRRVAPSWANQITRAQYCQNYRNAIQSFCIVPWSSPFSLIHFHEKSLVVHIL